MYAYEDGPPDTDAMHTWTPVDGAPPPIIGDQGSVWPPALPYLKLIEIEGWLRSAELEDNRAGRTFGFGDFVYPSRKLGKTLVYKLQARAGTLVECRRLVADTIAGFDASTDDEGAMVVEPYEYIGGLSWTFGARCIDYNPDATFSYFPRRRAAFRQNISVTLRMSDPHFYTVEEEPQPFPPILVAP